MNLVSVEEPRVVIEFTKEELQTIQMVLGRAPQYAVGGVDKDLWSKVHSDIYKLYNSVYMYKDHNED